MICEDMSRIGLGNPNEYFIQWMASENLDWKCELEFMIEKKSENGLFAVKIMANQIRHIDRKLAGFFSSVDSGPFPHFRAAFSNAEWIFVHREDSIAQAISHFLAKSSGIYHIIKNRNGFVPGSSISEGAEKEDVPKVPYDFDKLLSEWHNIQAGNLLWSEFFRELGIEPLNIEYSTYDLRILRQIGNRLGIIMKEPEGARNLVKMTNERNLKMSERFKEDIFLRL